MNKEKTENHINIYINYLNYFLKGKSCDFNDEESCDFNDEEELFKRIDGYDNYFVSNFGNVKNSKTNKILKPGNHIQGYKLINLYKNKKAKSFRVHRLVGMMFLQNPDNKSIIDHIDNNPSNNNVKNLRWCSQKDNLANQDKRTKNTTGFKGVAFHKPSKKYQANININGKLKHLGYFKTAEEASQVYEAKAREIHGEFYYKNK